MWWRHSQPGEESWVVVVNPSTDSSAAEFILSEAEGLAQECHCRDCRYFLITRFWDAPLPFIALDSAVPGDYYY